MSHEFEYLYLNIKRDAQTDRYSSIILSEVDRYTRMNKDMKFERHEATVNALKYVLKELDEQHHVMGRIQSPGIVRAYITRYLNSSMKDQDIPGLKL